MSDEARAEHEDWCSENHSHCCGGRCDCGADTINAHIDALQAERDAAVDAVRALESALSRTELNFVSAVRGVPVRDMAENLAENEAALALAWALGVRPAVTAGETE